MMRLSMLRLLGFCMLACDDGAGVSADGNVPPACADGAQVFDDYATCGAGCTIAHQEGECAPGYTCTCNGMCMWWENGFPQDAGTAGCFGGPPDAGLTDGGTAGDGGSGG